MDFEQLKDENPKEDLFLTTFPETRAVYLQISAKTTEMEIISKISSFAEAGFNVLFIDVFKYGYTNYFSEVMKKYNLPQINPIFQKSQPLKTLFKESNENNIKVYGVIDLLCAGAKSVNKIGPILKKYPKWGLRNKEGDFSPIEKDDEHVFLCPSHQSVRHFLADLCYEMLDSFPFYGIVVDLLSYPFWTKNGNISFCDCEVCEVKPEENQSSSSEDLTDTEKENLKEISEMEHKSVITGLLYYIIQRLFKTRKPLHFLLKFQGNFAENTSLLESLDLCKSWVKSGIFNEIVLDGLPAGKLTFQKSLENDLRTLYENTLVLPTISTDDTSEICSLIDICREYPVPGFVYRNPELFEEPDYKKLKESLKEPGEQIELNTLKSICQLILRMVGMTYSVPQLFDFFQDFLKFIEIESVNLSVKRIEAAIENFNSIEKNMNKFNMDEDMKKKMVSTISLIKRILYFHISFIHG